MVISTTWQIPQSIMHEGEKFFVNDVLQLAKRFVGFSRVSISFSKGTPETYFIVSGIIKDDRTHESKVVFKKRLEGTEEGPVSSNCDCHHWSEDKHCPHSVALFLTYHLHHLHEKNFDGINENTSHPPIALDSTFAVGPMEYGTIVSGPHKLERAPSNSAYSSLQYLLHSKKIINFPIPENFKGKIVFQATSSEYFNEKTGELENLPLLKFKYRNSEGKLIKEISIFENLYLFDWVSGEAYHLSGELKSLIHKVRLFSPQLNINELIKIAQAFEKQESIEVIIDDVLLQEIPTTMAQPRIEITKGTKKGAQIDFVLNFLDNNGIILPVPEFLQAFSFTGGLLGSFKKKKDAYDFILALGDHFENQSDEYKKVLQLGQSKNRWTNILNYILKEEHTYLYNPKTKSLVQYDNSFLRDMVHSFIKFFGELFFRFSYYLSESQEMKYQVSGNVLFQGLSDLHAKLTPFGVNIFYNKNEISRWSSKVRFERRASTTKWFELELDITDQDLEVIQNADLSNGLALTKNGLVLLTKEKKDLLRFIKKYTEYESEHKVLIESDNPEEGNLNKFVLPFNRARIFELFELKKLGIEGALTEEEIALCERLSNLEEIPEYDCPEALADTLRPYQLTGYRWLKFLYESRLGACLADDMGLGKTLQTICFIKSIYHEVDRVLIVCPVTILLNWENEFKKFSDDMDIHIYHGGERKFSNNAKIILTSYGVMKREIEETFAEKEFDILVLDEVQHLKNIRSQGAFAARQLKANFRICLTGTPVENDLSEFYNILDLAIPGIWGDLQFIRTTSNKKSRLLARKTAAPFILRRTKGQVLTDLPPKIENNVLLQFSEHEQSTYKSSLTNIRQKIDSAPSKKKYGEILRGLLELRQKCLWQHRKGEMAFPGPKVDSIKIQFLMETLEQILEEGHQALIFSQFTTYLDIIQEIIRERHWKIARIDGSQSIKKRQEQVEVFQERKAPIFLISLKAGGVGLNLTAASYVFIMDPWWNPAVEQQAVDRAHRIGQKNQLTVYRPLIQGSVEEKVLELQKMKKELFNDLLPEDENELFTGKLSMRDFEDLLSL
jgi:SNF2 family DNA or RNA helicase